MAEEKTKPLEKKEEKPKMEKPKTEKVEEKKKIVAKPLPVDKEKANAMEKGLEGKIEQKDKPKSEDKKEDKKEKSKKKETSIVKKEDAVARGTSVPISKKQAMYICSFIKNKDIDVAIADLGKVINFKQAVPFKGEIPHRKGKMMSGRYPIKASGYFINLLKALKGNSLVNGLELEKTRIYFASASWAARPMRRGGRQAKRTNVILKAKEIGNKDNKEKVKEKKK